MAARADVQADLRLGEPEVLVEHLGELAVVVLAGVERDEVDLPPERGVQRGRLDELGPVAGDGEEAHG
jgi:hypothetical protein